MKIHLATWPPQKQIEQTLGQAMVHERTQPPMKLRILISYHYYREIDLDELFAKYFRQPYPDVFADSGAYSAMTQQAPIAIDEYAEWLLRWKHLFSVYANLDVIMHAEQTWQNQQYLEDKYGLTPLPAFHVREDFTWLERYIERYPYIALGVAGMQSRKNELMAWLVRCFKLAGGHSVYHGFALTSWQVMASFPWYSVDSSSWGSGFRFGSVPIFDDRRGRFVKLKLGDGQAWAKHAHLVRRLGFSPSDFADRSRNDRAKICALSALSYMLAEEWLRKRWGEIVIPEREQESGLQLHLVAGPSNADTPRGGNMSIKAMAEAGLPGTTLDDGAGMKNYLGDSQYTPLRDMGLIQTGLRMHLAEHSLDRGGLGDTSRAMEVLEQNDNR